LLQRKEGCLHFGYIGGMDPPFSGNSTVKQVLTEYAQTAPVFIELRTLCVGCAINQFCTLGDVASIYHIPPGLFLEKLHASIPAFTRSDQ